MSIADIRVLDLGWVWAGPLVGAAFADLGADVVKVESSARLDPYRLRGVERDTRYADNRHEASPSFHKLNRGKRSMTIDLRNPAGRDLVLRLAEHADLLIENFRAGTLARLGMGWSELRERNPALVALSMSAGGQVGRWRDMKAYALVTTALAGYESLVAYDGEPPVGGATFGIADPNISSFGVLAAMAGIWRARRTGHGAHIDLSGVESVVAVLGAALVLHEGAALPSVEITVRCAGDDLWLLAALTGPDDLDRLLTGIGSDNAAGRHRWAELVVSADARNALHADVERWTSGQDRDDAVKLLAENGITVTPILSLEERNATAAVRDRTMRIVHPVTGEEPVLESAWGTAEVPNPAPLLGQHTDQVLTEWLDLSDAEIAELRTTGALS
jgi:crotonobetainyl-CoA:carnitine CoA-transferase CaiB-like acyl-CoA transferase